MQSRFHRKVQEQRVHLFITGSIGSRWASRTAPFSGLEERKAEREASNYLWRRARSHGEGIWRSGGNRRSGGCHACCRTGNRRRGRTTPSFFSSPHPDCSGEAMDGGDGHLRGRFELAGAEGSRRGSRLGVRFLYVQTDGYLCIFTLLFETFV